MSLKKSVISLLILLSIIATGCSKNVVLDEDNGNILNYNFKIADIENIDETLSNQKYAYSTNIENKYVAVITYQSKTASLMQYLIGKYGTVDLTVPKDSSFIISLPANRTIAYTWNIEKVIDNGVIQFANRSWIEIPMPESEKGKEGANYDRQNFYFKPLKSGDEKVVLRYEHQTEQQDDFFEITFNVKIEQ